VNGIGQGTFVEIMGYRGGGDPTEELKAFREAAQGASVQTLDSRSVAGKKHILLALKQTVELARTSQLLAERPEVDFLLRIGGTRQISQAVRTTGARPGSESVVVIFGSKEAVRKGAAAVGRVKELKPFSGSVPGEWATKRTTQVARDSVVGSSEVVPHLLAEKAALLRR